MIVINNPHNPCGSLIDAPTLRAICEVAEDAGAYLHSDEAYRGLYVEEGAEAPSAIDLYDKAVVTGSFSKPISLTGLRLGWIASDAETIQECMRHRDYTTISKGMIDDALATLAIGNIDKILRRNNRIIRENHRFIDRWLKDESLMEWVPPTAGSVGFMKHHLDVPAEELCRRLIEEKSTFMVPGDCFGFPDHVRIGFGNRLSTLQEGFRRVKEYLDAVRN
jgi:aspartate/methionine/tyrosine aminotransferase